MRIAITGTPGVGKTAIAKELGKVLGHKVLNEREFALKEGIGEFNAAENVLEVPLEKLGARLNKLLAKEKNIIVEGHLLCEIRGMFDWVVVLRLHPERLAARLGLRGYKDEKVQDNVFCEGIDYCKKHSMRNYGKAKVIEVENRKTIKDTTHSIVKELFLRAKPVREISRKKRKEKKSG